MKKTPLKGHKIGLSISKSEDAEAYGLSEDELNRVLTGLSENLLGQGAWLCFGHDWRRHGIMEEVTNIALRYKRLSEAQLDPDDTSRPIQNFAHAQEVPDLPGNRRTELQRVLKVHDLQAVDPTRMEQLSPEIRMKIALFEMRDRLSDEVDGVIALGGKVESAGWLPGILEEALRNLSKNHHVLLCSAFGGISAMLFKAMIEEDADARSKIVKLFNVAKTRAIDDVGSDAAEVKVIQDLRDIFDHPPEQNNLWGSHGIDAEAIVVDYIRSFFKV